MVFCKTDCENRFVYSETLGIEKPTKHYKECLNCGDELVTTYVRIDKPKRVSNYCNTMCQKAHQKRERIKESNAREKREPMKGNKTPYEVMEKIAERKRVFDEKHAYWFVRRGGSYS